MGLKGIIIRGRNYNGKEIGIIILTGIILRVIIMGLNGIII